MAVMQPAHRPETLPFSAALRSAFLGYCPNCLLGKIFRAPLRPKPACDVCGMLFEHQGETCMATAVILYFLICFGLAVEGLTLGLLFGIFPGFVPLLVLSAAAMFLLLHRPVRGIWVWCLWRMGFLR